MPIYDIFSKLLRRKKDTGEKDVYQYDHLPDTFRTQVVYILNDTIGKYTGGWNPIQIVNSVWDDICYTLKREYGVPYLYNDPQAENSYQQCIAFFMTEEDTKKLLDVIEVAFTKIDTSVRDWAPYQRQNVGVSMLADDAISELNQRFEEHGIGYFYSDGVIMRKDSQYIHQEVVKPALLLLNEAHFRGPSEEFLEAYRLYRNGEDKPAVAGALNSFESTMKAICDKNKWEYSAKVTAFQLINILIKNGLIPDDMLSHFSGLRSALESGLPTLSHKRSRHGQGAEPIILDKHMVSYALHLCAANIVFLINADKARQ